MTETLDKDVRKSAAARALPMVDLTNLNADCSHADIDVLCERAHTPHGRVGAICIWPRFVAHAHKVLTARARGKVIPIATVVNFPGGTDLQEMTVLETATCIRDGADEIDLVIPYGAFKAGDEEAASKLVRAIAQQCAGKALLKVIIETGELGSDELIRKASHMAIEAGANFIKTSTGKVPINATPHAAEIMIQAIADSGKPVGFKPAGGVKTVEDTATYLAIADRIMGPDWAAPKTFRFGASGVLDDLLAALDGDEAATSGGY
ncbi:deoxyribose-phosphate aldolase [Pseudahrensia aquimaris]|uniref:Deoxyribose-phosphate aldolase n=1 Tax=Pseudahrensia aquimaris TaxID=744461 RepID=A0ABW3FGD1_9HYPH